MNQKTGTQTKTKRKHFIFSVKKGVDTTMETENGGDRIKPGIGQRLEFGTERDMKKAKRIRVSETDFSRERKPGSWVV